MTNKQLLIVKGKDFKDRLVDVIFDSLVIDDIEDLDYKGCKYAVRIETKPIISFIKKNL